MVYEDVLQIYCCHILMGGGSERKEHEIIVTIEFHKRTNLRRQRVGRSQRNQRNNGIKKFGFVWQLLRKNYL